MKRRRRKSSKKLESFLAVLLGAGFGIAVLYLWGMIVKIVRIFQ